jgi:23S rRNA (uracil1939-C5)-methyltransferase
LWVSPALDEAQGRSLLVRIAQRDDIARQTCFTPGMPVTLQITELGSQGDGIAEHAGQKVFVPRTLPGETVTVELEGKRARLLEVTSSSPDRVAQRCPHYGECGGCSLQHMADGKYLEFKRSQVATALSMMGIDAPVDPIVPITPRTRRRAAFAAYRSPGGIVVGFHGQRSHHITAIRDCPVITLGLQELLPKVERLAAIAAPRKDALTVTVTETPAGFDVALNGADKDFSADTRVKLVQTAQAIGLARISVNGDVVMEARKPGIPAGRAFMIPPAGGFLQATGPSEAMMVELVKNAVGNARKVVDLYSGSGTFSLPLAETATVHAVEVGADALAALTQAARSAPGLKPVTTETRDLSRRPLIADELKRFDAAVIDPPYAGAEVQCVQLAKSGVKRIAMVSCNAQTFARDLKLLMAGGYKVKRITPVDQFLWSAHIEIVAALER